MNVLTRNYYFILEIEPDAKQREIEIAYRRLALIFHPDLNQSPGANLRMQEINEAYTTLHHPEKRTKYDREFNFRTAYTHRRAPEPTPYHYQQRRHNSTPPVQPQAEKYRSDGVAEEQVVIFYLDHSSYGLCIKHIEGILMMQPISPDMRAPAFAEGIIAARGQEIPIVDLRRHFGMRQQPVTRDSRIILGSVNGTKMGLVVDSIENYINIPVDDIEPSPSILPGQKVPFIRGIARRGEQLIVILDLPSLFTEDEFRRLQKF